MRIRFIHTSPEEDYVTFHFGLGLIKLDDFNITMFTIGLGFLKIIIVIDN